MSGFAEGAVAWGIEEVAEATLQGVVAVLFVPLDCWKGGEAAARSVAANGGRSYIVHPKHEIYEDLSLWDATAVLTRPLIQLETGMERPGKVQRIGTETSDAA